MTLEEFLKQLEREVSAYRKAQKEVEAYKVAMDTYDYGNGPMPSKDLQWRGRYADDEMSTIKNRIANLVLRFL